MNQRILIKTTDIDNMLEVAARMPAHDGHVGRRMVRALIEYMGTMHGIDLGIETEDMKEWREKNEALERNKKNRSRFRKQHGIPDDDF